MSIVLFESDNGTKQLTIDRLNELRKKIPEEYEKALDVVWDKIFLTAIMLCPVDTGTLMSTIRIERGGGVMSGFSGIKAITIFDSTIVAGDERIINPKSGQPCIYSTWVHDGHFDRGGKWVPAQPFLTDAVNAHEEELERALDNVNKALEENFGRE
ncbi:hypothetical protein A3K80_00535 [Candidatus Bathyarchaeota archaeon RBG_13_38_9]|nr:MAG: hypothetical protein A3K80_00535 [Candidatus Bathyarchaeota archaeon RBG_13_38_9]